VSEAEPVAAAKDFSKPAIVILGYGLNPGTAVAYRLWPDPLNGA
jgi:hypothetical protein